MRRSYALLHRFAIVVILAFATFPATAQTQLSSDLREKIDHLAAETRVVSFILISPEARQDRIFQSPHHSLAIRAVNQ